MPKMRTLRRNPAPLVYLGECYVGRTWAAVTVPNVRGKRVAFTCLQGQPNLGRCFWHAGRVYAYVLPGYTSAFWLTARMPRYSPTAYCL